MLESSCHRGGGGGDLGILGNWHEKKYLTFDFKIWPKEVKPLIRWRFIIINIVDALTPFPFVFSFSPFVWFFTCSCSLEHNIYDSKECDVADVKK